MKNKKMFEIILSELQALKVGLLTLSMPGGGRADSAPLRFFLHNSKTPGDIEKKLSHFNFTPLTDILRILSITIVVRCYHSNLLFPVCHLIFWLKKQRSLNYFQDNYLIKLKFGTGGYFRPWIQFMRNFNVCRHFDVIMTKLQNIHTSETKKVHCIIMTSFINQNSWNFAQGLIIWLYFPTLN